MKAPLLQIYSAEQLQEIRAPKGFNALGQCGLDESEFQRTESENIVMIARKV